MESLDLDELHMSGARAVFRNSVRIDKEEIAEAFDEQGMKLVSYRKERRPREIELYKVDSGVT